MAGVIGLVSNVMQTPCTHTSSWDCHHSLPTLHTLSCHHTPYLLMVAYTTSSPPFRRGDTPSPPPPGGNIATQSYCHSGGRLAKVLSITGPHNDACNWLCAASCGGSVARSSSVTNCVTSYCATTCVNIRVPNSLCLRFTSLHYYTHTLGKSAWCRQCI